ncbi:unnamed protein product [Didymodactylos carnosus]|uniref:Major facilitator superfamily (MFS) profile domain-containing protein n=1 Tax=Didymodactylos carnosus TaxID=1234261 RepID=A0A815WLM7_9BILA|nr:unnamed protein product [Didymodactylos carnosus]CAF4402866.1 unnamed protein product [Didymodactylos carnosus]
MRVEKQQQQDGTEVTVDTQMSYLSIYDTYTKLKKTVILVIISFMGFLATFDEAVYLPALPALVIDLHTTESLGLLTISIYLLAISLSGLIWGVLTDYYGRKLITSFALAGFLLAVIGCYFSPNIYLFLVCRILQGCLVSVTLVVGQATIADIYVANERGSATGVFYGFYFSAVLLGPAVGGQLSHHFGWRSTFIVVGLISFFLLISYILFVPETQQYKVANKYRTEHNVTLAESDQLSKPTLTNPCVPLLYLKDSRIIPYVFVLAIGYVSINVGYLLFSTQLAKAPYNYQVNIIGLLYIPVYIAMFIGSIVGAKLADLVAIKYFQTSKIVEGCIVPGLIFSLLTPIGLIIYGWSVQFGANILFLILGQVFYGLGQAATRPGIYSYYTIRYQQNSAAIISANNFVQLSLTSIVLSFSATIVQTIQIGPYFTIMAVYLGLTSSSPTSQKEYEFAENLYETIKSVKSATTYRYSEETTMDVDDDPFDYSSSSDEEEGHHDNNSESEEEVNGEESKSEKDKHHLANYSLDFMQEVVDYADEKDKNGKRRRSWKTVHHSYKSVPNQSYVSRFRTYLHQHGTKRQKTNDIDEIVFKNILHAREQALPLHDVALQRWALKAAKEVHLEAFHASHGWVNNFKPDITSYHAE